MTTTTAPTIKTLGVLAGAYKGGRRSLKVTLTHAVETVDDYPVRALCNRVPVDSICDYAETPDATPTCPRCAAKDPRKAA